MSAPEPELHAAGDLIGGRYRVRHKLGGGGMALVYEVVDATGRRLALKQPDPSSSAEQQRRGRELLAREFHTLAQLAHPRIVAVYDYGHDERGPYYTMELLDGGDLSQLARADFRKVCAIARDVCSALSLLHSRRVLHRDISARNVRCSADGTAKLIDFGAMTLMGPNKELVGTPVYAAPEVVNLQPLDARTDLYALGATLYFALTGHHAYPVRDFASLPNAWGFAVTRPSELVPDIPEALESLVLDLLQLDPRNRPSSAAEVTKRLAAIEGKPVAEHLLVAQAYLSTPAFVGREPELEQVRNKCQRALRNRGSATLVRGVAGVGRSRFLDASVLAAKLLGMTVIRADAQGAQAGEYGTVRALLAQLHRALPELAGTAAVSGERELLAHFLPELAAPDSPAPADAAAVLRPRQQAAIGRWLLAAAAQRPLLIAIDDLQRADEASLATLALLSRGLRDAPLAIVATAETGTDASAGSAFRVYDDVAVSVVLQPLDVLETRSLLSSVFGEHQNLDLLVHRLFGVSQGYPRDLLRLAQHLVDRQLVRYRAGAWSLPSHIDTSDLPASVAQLLRSRAQALRPTARSLAHALAFCPEHSFSFEECRVLADEDELGPVVGDVGQLIRADIVRTSHEQLALRDRAWLPVLRDEVDRVSARAIHLRLARVFEQRGGEDFRVAQHLLRADEHDAAVDRLVAHAVSSMAVTDKSPEEFFKLISALPEDWLETYEAGLELCRALERPKHEIYALQARLTGLVAVIGLRDTRHVRTLIADLGAAAGLDDWAALDPRLEPMPRLVQALQAVQARYDAADEHERTIEPVAAIRALARAFITAVGMSTPLFDLPALRALPSLAPLTPLSPALGVIEELVESVIARLSGRFDRARAHYQVLLERVAAPDRAGFDESHHRYMCIGLYNGMGLLEAVMGLGSSRDWADRIEAVDSLFKVNAVLVRMLYHLWQGDCAEAERHKSQLAALRIASSARQSFEHTHLIWQLSAHAQLEDLTRLERTLDEITHAVGHHPGWQPVLAYGHAEYQRVRGDPARAVVELERALLNTRAGDHQIWADLAGAHVRALDERGDTAAAVSCGDEYLERASAAALEWTSYSIRVPLCVARAKLGDPRAAQEADDILSSLVARGTTGLALSLAFEARARVALAFSDGAAYQQYHGLLVRDAQRASNTALSIKAQKLRREAQRRQLASIAPPAAQLSRRAVTTTLLQQELAACNDPAERARLSLALLAEHSGVTEGVLYQMRAEGLLWTASLDGREPDAALDAMVREYVAAELHGDELPTGSGSAAGASTEWSSLGEASFRPVLLCHYVEAGYAVSGVAVFALRLGARFVYPIELASRISRTAVEVGDAVGAIVKAR